MIFFQCNNEDEVLVIDYNFFLVNNLCFISSSPQYWNLFFFLQSTKVIFFIEMFKPTRESFRIICESLILRFLMSRVSRVIEKRKEVERSEEKIKSS